MAIKNKTYTVTKNGKTCTVTIPGSEKPGIGPRTVAEFRRFIAEALEAYAKTSNIGEPEMHAFVEGGETAGEPGLRVVNGAYTFQIKIKIDD